MLLPTSWEHVLSLYGPQTPGTDEAEPDALHAGTATFTLRQATIHLQLAGPFGAPITAAADDLARALLVARSRLPAGWLPLVQGARRDAWHSTADDPCARDQVRLYPQLDQPPAAEPVAVLAGLGEHELTLLASAREQVAYHQEWAGESRVWSQLTQPRP